MLMLKSVMMDHKKSISSVSLSKKRVLLRVDFNVPLSEIDGHIRVADDFRIKQTLPTIKSLVESGAKTVILAHAGRPKGTENPTYSLLPVAQRLSDLLETPVKFISSNRGVQVQKAADELSEGEILVLENMRFTADETENDPEFAAELSKLGEVFVQEAFGNLHRKHASMVGIPSHLPTYTGFLVEKEIDALQSIVDSPEKPLYAIIGGSKISTKIELIESMLSRAQGLIIGGAMANTFLKAKKINVGKSLVEDDEVDEARRIIRVAAQENIDLVLPLTDVAVAKSVDKDAKRTEKALNELDDDDVILDFGKKSTEDIKRALVKARTIVWNGPLGMTELPEFEYGSLKLAEFLAAHEGKTVIGGGDTAGFIHEKDMIDKFYHVSTGGGASLELLSGKKLPGLAFLED